MAENVEEDDLYEVEEILDSLHVDDDVIYLVKWAGYDDSQCTWEPAAGLQSCENAINDYIEKKKNAEKEHEKRAAEPNTDKVSLFQLAKLYENMKAREESQPKSEEEIKQNEYSTKIRILYEEIQNLKDNRPNLIYSCEIVNDEIMYHVNSDSGNYSVSSTAIKLYNPQLIIKFLEHRIHVVEE